MRIDTILTDTTRVQPGDIVEAVWIPAVTDESGEVEGNDRQIKSRIVRVTDVTPTRLYGSFASRRTDSTEWSEGILYFTSWKPVVPKVGDRVRAYNIPGFHWNDGLEVTVSHVNDYGSSVTLQAEFPSNQKPDDTINLAFEEWALRTMPGEDESLVVTYTQADIDRAEAEAARWKRLAEQREQALITGKETHADLGNRLLAQAENRGWCSEFDEFVSDYNADCPAGWEIEERLNLVEQRVRVTGTVYRDITVWVKDGEDVTDPDNWYETNDTDDHVGDDYVSEQLDSEFENNGWDDTSVRSL